MFNLFKKYYRIDKAERKILKITLCWIVYSLVLVRFVPLKWFNKLLGKFKVEENTNLDNEQLEIVHKVLKNIKRLKTQVPWKVKCFEEAITAKKVLEKYKIASTLYLGVDKNINNELIAHAWLKCDGDIVTGEGGYAKYTVVGFYS